MKHLFYLVVGIFLIIPLEMKSQVMIGSTDDPHEGAILELKTTGNSGNQRGFLLPRVVLTSANSWSPLAGTSIDGMLVYNTGTSSENNLNGSGIYIWSEGFWLKTSMIPAADVIPELLILDYSFVELSVGENLNITTTFYPANSTNQTITWTSADSSIASVSGGIVTAIYPGTTTITATTASGNITAKCIIKIPTVISLLQVGILGTEEVIEFEDLYTEVTFNRLKAAYKNAKDILMISDRVSQTEIDEIANEYYSHYRVCNTNNITSFKKQRRDQSRLCRIKIFRKP